MNVLSEDSIFGQIFGFTGKYDRVKYPLACDESPHRDDRGLDHGHVLHGAETPMG